jgi:hypothetical protein
VANGTDNSGDGSSSVSIVTVAAAAASSIGVLGFVTLAGGVVLWRRFVEMGLPADHAVALVPTPVLVATGAEFLLPAVVLTVVPALTLMLIKIKTNPASAPGPAPANAAAAADAAAKSAAPAAGAPAPAGAVAAGAVAEARPSGWVRVFSEVLELIHLKPNWQVEPGRAMSYWWALRVGLTVVIVEIIVALAASNEIGFVAFLILAAIAMAGGLVVGVAFRFIRSGAAVALIAFLAVGTFWVARAYEKTSHALTVVPMAYTRSEMGFPSRVETGYLVAETSDRIWFASLPHPDRHHPFNELRAFPRSEIEDLEVGTLVAPLEAQRNAKLFLDNLCQRLISEASAHKPHAHAVVPNGCPAPPKARVKPKPKTRAKTRAKKHKP